MQLNDYQKKALKTAKDEKVELMHRSLGLAGEAGEVAGKLTKWYRDTKGDMAELDKKSLAAELGDVLWFTAALADFIGYSLDDIAKQNIEKLADRDRRNVIIGGSGDNR